MSAKRQNPNRGGCAFLPFRAHSIRLHARDSAKGLIMPTPAEMKAKKLKQKQATLLSTSRDMATVRMAASMHVSETQNRRLARGHYSSLPLAHLTGDLLADSPGISPEASGRRKSSKEGLDQLMQVRHRELSSPVEPSIMTRPSCRFASPCIANGRISRSRSACSIHWYITSCVSRVPSLTLRLPAPNPQKVDLAYWSNFVEVRRDTASAFAALSMNGKRVTVLAS